MGTLLNEPIKVGVIFSSGMVRPAWFIWHGQRYDVKDVTMRWQTNEGAATILHLSVTDGAMSFELALNQRALTWSLVAVETNGCE